MPDLITTKRLILRPPRVGDADVVIAGLNDFDVVKWLARPPFPFTRADLRLANADGSSRWPGLAAIEHHGKMIGMVSGEPHLGFWLLQSAWGQGFATEAARGMIDMTFATSGVDRLRSGYFEGNLASARVLDKLGFRKVGHGSVHCVSRGEDVPHCDLELTRMDWEAVA